MTHLKDDIAMHKSEEIWQNLLTAIIKEESNIFQPAHWSWIKKQLYPLTHENVHDFIPQPIAVAKSYHYGDKHGYEDAQSHLEYNDQNQNKRTFEDCQKGYVISQLI